MYSSMCHKFHLAKCLQISLEKQTSTNFSLHYSTIFPSKIFLIKHSFISGNAIGIIIMA